MTAGRVIGIDLGTTNSVLAVIRDGTPVLVPVDGERLLPSVVGASEDDQILIGSPARNQWVAAPERTVRSIKRRMGTGDRISLAGRQYSPQEVSAFLLHRIREAAEAALGEPVRRAVITVPAYFDEVQRQATIEAGEIAGLQVERILNEPTAAALAYGYGRGDEADLRMLVYDLGGGTFDVSVIELNHGIVEVLATAGDNRLGGDDFDERIAELLAEEFQEEHGVDLRDDHQAWARLLRAAEEAKIRLSDMPVTSVTLDYLTTSELGTPLHLRRELERWEQEERIADLLEATADGIRRALDDASLSAGEIDRVLLVGGSTRIPAVWSLTRRVMNQDPHGEIDSDAAVALGAAVQAGIVAGEDVGAILVDVTPLSLGVETAYLKWTGEVSGGHFTPLVRRNTTIPVRKSERFTTLVPGQEKIQVKVYQGESPVAAENTLLGEFQVEDLTADDEDSLADILIDFTLDVNGILDVTVTDGASRRETSARLRAARRRMSPEEIASSRETVSRAGSSGGPSSRSDRETAALVARALAVLDDGALPDRFAAELRDVLLQLEQASSDGRPQSAQVWSDRLADLLIEVDL